MMFLIAQIKQIKNRIPYYLPSSTVLMFHHVTDTPKVKRSILMGSDRFKSFIDSFDNYTDIETCMSRYKRKQMTITFDDALADVYTIAFPYLEKKGIPFTIFVAPGLLDRDGYISVKQLTELSRSSLVTIGSHSLSHVPLKGRSTEFQYKEINESKRLLEEIIEKEVTLIAYPYGQCDANTITVIKKSHAYEYGFLASGGPINAICAGRELKLPRLRVDDMTLGNVVRLLRSVYNPVG